MKKKKKNKNKKKKQNQKKGLLDICFLVIKRFFYLLGFLLDLQLIEPVGL